MKTYLEQLMKEFPFVMWDRFTKGEGVYTAYGWIDRETDQYKDFLVLEVHESGGVSFVTSSPHYTSTIHTILFGNDSGAFHNPCQRVEDHFKIKNCIKLK